jgi:hypothetical protein
VKRSLVGFAQGVDPDLDGAAVDLGSGSIHRLNIEYDGWRISSGVPSLRRISAARAVRLGSFARTQRDGHQLEPTAAAAAVGQNGVSVVRGRVAHRGTVSFPAGPACGHAAVGRITGWPRRPVRDGPASLRHNANLSRRLQRAKV